MNKDLYSLQRAFTIIEVLIVITIIGILATVTVVAYRGITSNAAASVLKNDIKAAAGQLALAKASDGSYPANTNGLPKSEDTTYQYTLTDGNYCLSATSTKAGVNAYHISSTTVGGVIEEGVCSGHTLPNPGNDVAWTQRTGAGSHYWNGIATSSDGAKLVAGAWGGYIYTSSDSGATWTQRTASGSRNWGSIASSSDGSKLIAFADVGFSYYNGMYQPTNSYIYTSSDSGATWTQHPEQGSHRWGDVASSSDGTKLTIIAMNDNDSNPALVYTSSDSGATWTQHSIPGGPHILNSLASSADGTKIIVGGEDDYIYTSSDSGATWTQRNPAGVAGEWMGVDSSSDGVKLVAVDYYGSDGDGGYIYTSADSGATWVKQTGPGAASWGSVAASSDGSRLIAMVAFSGDYYTSSDSGATWVKHTDQPGNSDMSDVVTSADGLKILTGGSDGYLYTGVYQ